MNGPEKSLGEKAIKFLRRTAIGGAGVLFLGGVSGCTQIEDKPTTSKVDASTNATTGDNIEPTTKDNTVTTTEKSTSPEDAEMNEKMALAPNLEGAKKVVKEINGYKRVTYVAENGNPYGAEAGKYLGEFKKEVSLENKEVGGVALIPTVVEKLLKDGLAKTPAGKEKWFVFAPEDITELKKNTEVKMETVADPLGNENVFLKISCAGEEVSVSNIVYDRENRGFNNSIKSSILIDTPVGFGINSLPDEQHRQEWITVMGKFKFKEEITGQIPVRFGEKVTETIDPIIVYVASNVAGIIDDNRILKVGKSFVFVIDK